MIGLDSSALRRLVEATAEQPVLTLYLPVDPSDPENQRAPGTEKWRVRLGNQLSALSDQVGDDRDARARWQAVTENVEGWLANAAPSGRTLVLLADEHDVTDIELPVVLEQRAGYGPPRVDGLVRAMSDHHLYLTVLVDQQTVRAVSGYLGFVQDVARLDLSGPWGMPGATRSGHQFRFEARREEYQERYHADVADQIDRYLVDNPDVERLVIGGATVEAHGVARALSQRSHQALLGVLPIPVDASDADVAERISVHAQAFEEQHDHEVMAALGAARAAGRGVTGADEVVASLVQYLARDVIVSSHLADADLIERVTRLAVLSGAAIRFVHRAAADEIDTDGGVAARLYYAVPPETLTAE